MADFQQIAENVVAGNAAEVQELVQSAVSAGETAQRILNDGLLAGMSVVGTKFKNNEFYIPEVLMAAKAMKGGVQILQPLLVGEAAKKKGTVVMGTVKGDLHDIGKNLVKMMLEGADFQVIDMGTDVSAETFVETARSSGANIIGLSALLTTTMPGMREVVASVNKSDLKGKVKVIVGGAPITQEYADEIGADGFAPDAASAVDLTKRLFS